jgi:hypothetical protein
MEKKTIIISVVLIVVALVLGFLAGYNIKPINKPDIKCKDTPVEKTTEEGKSYYLELTQNSIKKVIEIDDEGNVVYKENGSEKMKTTLDNQAKKMMDEYFEDYLKNNEILLINILDNKYLVFVNSDDNYYYQANKKGQPMIYKGNQDKTYYEENTINLVERLINMIDEKTNNPEKYADSKESDYSRDTQFVINALQQF